MKKSKHGSAQEAWEWLNEYLLLNETEIKEKGGFRSGPEIISYDHIMYINKLWVDPKFNFNIFGYTTHKWSKLISNYINFDYLDLVKSEVLLRQKRGDQNYNISFNFSNSHASGKGCLLSLVFSKRPSSDLPQLVVTIRSSETTKRLIFDFLLLQRMAEYVYGNNKVGLIVYIINAYTTAEALLLYFSHKSYEELFKGVEIKEYTFLNRVREVRNKFLKMEPGKLIYKVHLRTYNNMTLEDGTRRKEIKPLLAEDLYFSHVGKEIEFPDGIETLQDKKSYLKKLNKTIINKS